VLSCVVGFVAPIVVVPRGGSGRCRYTIRDRVEVPAAKLSPGFRGSLRRLRSFGDGVVVGSVSATAVDGALPLDGDVGLDARDNIHVEVTEILDFVLDLNAGVALALTLLLAEGPRVALLAHLRLAVQLRERRLLFASQGDLQVAQANRGPGGDDGDALSAVSGRRTRDLP